MNIMRLNGDTEGPPMMPEMNCPNCGCGSFSIQTEDGKRGARCMECKTWTECIDWEIAALNPKLKE